MLTFLTDMNTDNSDFQTSETIPTRAAPTARDRARRTAHMRDPAGTRGSSPQAASPCHGSPLRGTRERPAETRVACGVARPSGPLVCCSNRLTESPDRPVQCPEV
jgi:hypothetical protein